MKKTIALIIAFSVFSSFLSVQANACTVIQKENGSATLKGCSAKERADFIAKMEPVVIKTKVTSTANTQFANHQKSQMDSFREQVKAERTAFAQKVKAEKSAFAKEIESDLASVGIRSNPTSAFAELDSF